MEVRNAWGDVAMRDRNVRVGVVTLILAVPWLVGMVEPSAFSTGMGAGRIGTNLLMDLVLAFGFLWAGHERRALLSSRCQGASAGRVVPDSEAVETAAVSVPSSRPSVAASAI